MNQKDFLNVDWSKIPEPKLDFNLEHLNQSIVPDLKLNSTDDTIVSLSNLRGITVIYVYPMTGVPGKELPEGWDEIPGARGCTPQSCSFRDNFSKLKKLGVNNIFGLSTQSTEYQKELATRLHLPYPILSDEKLEFSKTLKLPMFKVLKMNLLKRITLILKDNKIIKYFYPIFPPTKNIEDVINFFETSTLE
jgi:peroxiredoxin (alkyl hydroperoxide reductase subunit C)